MIVYQNTKEGFSNDILTNNIDNIIASKIIEFTQKKTSPNEMRAFKNSLEHMERILNDTEIPDDCGISIEYHIPQTTNRIDFIISGKGEHTDGIIIVELKQWQSATLTSMDGIVTTIMQGAVVPTSHPSYQAYSYAALLKAFSATIEEDLIDVYPCAYLHNYIPDSVLTHEFYSPYTDKAPVFLKPDALVFRSFIKHRIRKGDQTNILSRIDSGRFRPSKMLSDSLISLLKGNKEFILIDEQKVVYETAKRIALGSDESNKNVLIVEGGPGTGKSVVAINLLVELTKFGLMTQYVTKTSAPREVYFNKLQGTRRMTELRRMFVGSGSFMTSQKNAFPALIVDEAHRITERTGFLRQGDNQIREIIDSSLFSLFFIDEDQRVHIDDYGEVAEIERIALQCGSRVTKMELSSQFRCNGSTGFLSWLDNTLQIRETANTDLVNTKHDFDFQIVETPTQLRNIIFDKNKLKNKARIVAGYCWDWKSKKKPEKFDVTFPQENFEMRWNLTTYGSTWIIDPDSVNEVGCIHTCQGLEVDYIGVIVGDDLIVRNGEVLVQPEKRSRMDRSIFGWKAKIKKNPAYYVPLIEAIIKNTYRTLMTRGMRGCYVYFVDKETESHFRKSLQSI